jgi:Predicted membrane protein (DUF2079)
MIFDTARVGQENVEGASMRRLAPWVIVWGMALALTIVSSRQSLERYRSFSSAWAWDLAYNNQWFWSLVKGDQLLSVRPMNSWGDEGPSIWVRTHLDPIRLLVVPFYVFYPGPETLIVANNVLIWLILPAAYGLVRSESRSVAVGLSGAALVPFTPILWPMLWNDFREMELALPFVIWAIHGFRTRHRGLAILGVAGMLASREEYSVMVASFALIPPREDEDIGTTYTWARTAVFVGAVWMLFAFLGSQVLMVTPSAPALYLKHFNEHDLPPLETGKVVLDYLVFGLASWTLLAFLAPRVALLGLPWLWGLSRGRWPLEFLSNWTWSKVRYAAPYASVLLASGLIGYARLGDWALRRRRGGVILAAVWLVAATGMAMASRDLIRRMDRIEQPISSEEARAIWSWIEQVGPDDAVLASYEVSAPLSSRKRLYSNRLQINLPPGFPRLDSEFHWVFLRKKDGDPKLWTDQGFDVVYQGDFLWIYRRGRQP